MLRLDGNGTVVETFAPPPGTWDRLFRYAVTPLHYALPNTIGLSALNHYLIAERTADDPPPTPTSAAPAKPKTSPARCCTAWRSWR